MSLTLRITQCKASAFTQLSPVDGITSIYTQRVGFHSPLCRFLSFNAASSPRLLKQVELSLFQGWIFLGLPRPFLFGF
jgi:hypothetical protein